jgi:hypothetical protein
MLSDTISSIFESTSDRKNGIFLKGHCFLGVISSIFERILHYILPDMMISTVFLKEYFFL